MLVRSTRMRMSLMPIFGSGTSSSHSPGLASFLTNAFIFLFFSGFASTSRTSHGLSFEGCFLGHCLGCHRVSLVNGRNDMSWIMSGQLKKHGFLNKIPGLNPGWRGRFVNGPPAATQGFGKRAGVVSQKGLFIAPWIGGPRFIVNIHWGHSTKCRSTNQCASLSTLVRGQNRGAGGRSVLIRLQRAGWGDSLVSGRPLQPGISIPGSTLPDNTCLVAPASRVIFSLLARRTLGKPYFPAKSSAGIVIAKQPLESFA